MRELLTVLLQACFFPEEVAYLEEATSAVLLRDFNQKSVVNWKKPSNFASTLADVVDVEYALKFNKCDECIHAMSQLQR